ncbi:MAG: nicotinate-nucleotide adenylyltransferase [Thermodesulfobacteriota bacterium]|nr:nicotinate-nucleotide adenylyltransferase [Thermodesulfobacteriota bacterium]
MKIGILGGTFDPIHLGHLRSAEEIGQELDLQKVYLIPSASPPHKIKESVTSFEHRLAMVSLALGDSLMIEALDMEGKRPGLSYSIETVKELYYKFSPAPEIFFILGMDAFIEIKTWREYHKFLDYNHFVIIQRAGYPPEGIESLIMDLAPGAKKALEADTFVTPTGKTIVLKALTLLDISSTRIREMVGIGKSIRFLVPEPVRQYIIQNGLYKF